MNCKICFGQQKKLISFYKAQKKENLFGLENNKKYKRTIYKCYKCGHFTNQHKFSFYLNKIYKNTYAKSSHGNIKKKFNSINNISKDKSSNYFRCKFINNLKFLKKKKRSLLDIGAGLGIFAYSMKKLGWKINAIEINSELNKFISKNLKIHTVGKNIIEKKFNKKSKYDLVTLNKVLEHFSYANSLKILKKIKNILTIDGFVYIEVPDGQSASKSGLFRQEFYFEHYNIFSKKSLKLYLENLNFRILRIQKIKEVTGKYTLRAVAR